MNVFDKRGKRPTVIKDSVNYILRKVSNKN